MTTSASVKVYGQQGDSGQKESFFRQSVLPIFEEHCFGCHSHKSGKAKGGLVLDSKSGWEKGGDSGPAVLPGNVDQSLLLQAIRYGDLKMPPAGKLPDNAIRAIERWIADGATDPRVLDPSKVQLEQQRNHWAFHPIQQPAVPSVNNTGWPKNDVDRFVLAKLEEKGLSPGPDADRYMWLRRVSLDLTGLPPSTEEIHGYVNDSSDQAELLVVNRLLESRAFGERWGRHWLDLVGFADQIGTANDIFAEHAWRYRDYVIDAFNSDKPIDQFIREQVAGDLLPHETTKQRSANLVATGFLLLGDLTIVEADKAKLRVDVVDQQVDKVGRAFLGMTLGCARCHDHKFDPVSQREYYALAGFFFSTESVVRAKWGVWSWPKVVDLPETPSEKAQRQALREQQQQRIDELRLERDRKTASQTELSDVLSKGDSLGEPAKSTLTKLQQETKDQIAKLNRYIQHAEFFLAAEPKAFAVQDISAPTDMQITIRGNAYTLGESVPRGFVQVVNSQVANSNSANSSAAPTIRTTESGRRELAAWLTDGHNPLTARVFVNRVWQKLFGNGIVPSVDYFGLPGQPPSHPELLDYLASQFQRRGWSQKDLIRSLVLSRAYRLHSNEDERLQQTDPDNRWLWRMNRQRLDAESIRDSLLFVSGRLVNSHGGPSLPLEFPENTGSLESAAVNPPFFQPNRFRTEQAYLRTVYLPVIRSAPQPGPGDIRNYFDFALPAEWVGQRATTAVPTQALFLINSAVIKDRAGDLAEMALKVTSGSASSDSATADSESRLKWLWLRVFGRPIEPEDLHDSLVFLQSLKSADKDERHQWGELCQALLASNEFLMRQ